MLKIIFWLILTLTCSGITMFNLKDKNDWLKFMPIVIFMAVVGCSMIM